ncbi:MAG: zinc-dependent metalloprotease [Phaeodactylibacter sp.]|nr:zinc-dependent metalloprotease [Phaeodactylibacter sp.]
MNKGIFTLILLAVLPLMSYAQMTHECGTVHDESMRERLLLNKKSYAKYLTPEKTTDVTYVPINFVVMGNSAGTTYAVDEAEVIEMLCALNESYMDQNIQFFLADNQISFFENDAGYSNPGDVNFTLISTTLKGDAINILIGLNATPPNGSGLGVTLGYYSPQRDWIVIKESEVNANSGTLPHEMGHYFSLAHPFNGWDCTSWDPAVHGNPVSLLTAPCSSVPVEFVNGSNCATAGDYLCDTPADYNLGFGASGCNYTGNCMDPNGDLLDPWEENIMGYFLNCSAYVFSNEQKALIKSDLDSRTNLATVTLSDFASPIGTTSLATPTTAEILPYYTDVLLTWEPVDGANRYILEVDINPNFAVTPITLTVWGTSKVLDLLQNKGYYWRVRPLSNYYFCASPTANGTFTTGLAVADNSISFVNDWAVAPNPLRGDQALQVQLNTDQAFNATLELRHIDGQLIHQQQARFQAGQQSLTIERNLNPGIYLLSLKTEMGVMTKRVVVN